jgi:hypothetical protein
MLWNPEPEARSVVGSARQKFKNYFESAHAKKMLPLSQQLSGRVRRKLSPAAAGSSKTPKSHSQRQTPREKNRNSEQRQRRLCVGISTMMRTSDGSDYMYLTLASLLAPLAASERLDMYVKMSTGDVGERNVAVANVSDWLDGVSELGRSERARRVKEDVEWRHATLDEQRVLRAKSRGRVDYARAIEVCLDGGGPAPDYVLVLEDDVVASDDWYRRAVETMDALDRDIAADVGVAERPRTFRRVFFFHTSAYLGYSGAAEFLGHVAAAAAIGTLATLAVVALLDYALVDRCKRLPSSSSAIEAAPTERPALAYWLAVESKRGDGHLRRGALRLALAVAALWLIAVAVMFIMRGRANVLPEPDKALHKTVYREDRWHSELCCAQAILYDVKSARSLVTYLYDPPKPRPCDLSILRLEHHRLSAPYFLYPPTFEHIGYRPAYNKTAHIKLANGPRRIV